MKISKLLTEGIFKSVNSILNNIENEPAASCIMKKLLLIFWSSTSFFLLQAQNSVEFTIAYGYTAIDIEELVDIDENPNSSATDWNNENIGFSGQYLFASSGKIGFGAELMYHHLYWYSVRVPYGYQPIYREYSVSTMRLTPFARFGYDQAMCLDAGLEFNFMDPLRIGLMLSGNYYVPINETIDLPIKLRFDIINNIVLTTAISVNLGLRFNL